MWTAAVAATKTLSALINSGVNIPHDHQLLKSCRSQAARCTRCAAAAINGLQAAAHFEQGNSGKMADMYYAHARTIAIKYPTDKDWNLDEDKLIPDDIVFDVKIKNEVKDSIEQSEKTKSYSSRGGIGSRGNSGRGVEIVAAVALVVVVTNTVSLAIRVLFTPTMAEITTANMLDLMAVDGETSHYVINYFSFYYGMTNRKIM
jgi:hypothetical protein